MNNERDRKFERIAQELNRALQICDEQAESFNVDEDENVAYVRSLLESALRQTEDLIETPRPEESSSLPEEQS